MIKLVILTVDDDPEVLRAVERDLAGTTACCVRFRAIAHL